VTFKEVLGRIAKLPSGPLDVRRSPASNSIIRQAKIAAKARKISASVRNGYARQETAEKFVVKKWNSQ
jgi:hypothetical protein